MDINFFKAFVQYNEMIKWASFHENEDCVKKVINADYWFAKEKVDSDADDDKFGLYLFLGIAIGAVVVIGILLLVIYLKRGSEEDEETTKA